MSHSAVTTPAGLVVPASAVTRTERVLPEHDFKALRRLVSTLKPSHLGLLVLCTDCKKPVDVVLEDRLVETVVTKTGVVPAAGGRIVLVCECTTWAVR